MLNRMRYWFGAVVRRNMRRQVAQFLQATQNVRQTQKQVLLRLMALNAQSDFGREHNLQGIRSVEDFRSRLPITSYEYFRPYIERLKAGQPSALLGPQNRLLMFTLTSGTTAGSKFIPVTSQFMKDYRRGWQIWAISAYDAHPQLFRQSIVQLVSDFDQFRTEGNTSCGNISGLVTTMQNRLVKTYYTVPEAVMKIGNADAKYYAALRFSIGNPMVGMVTTANPSTLIHLAKFGDLHKEELIRDIADGTLSTKFPVSNEVREKVGRYLRANPKRAKTLEAVASRTGHLYPQDYWPDMGLLAVWTGGSVGAYLNCLPKFYGHVPIRDHGLSASEGRMTIPLTDGSSDGVLDVGSHFFEFIPQDEHGSENPTVLEAHELEVGQDYFILLTTASGLCRYDIHDLVRCNGFVGTTPLLAFLNKGSHISSVTGEKISEFQVVTAVRECVEPLKLSLGHFTMAPVWGEPPGYRLLIEATELPSLVVGERLVRDIDVRLQQLNPEYGEKRKTGRLASLVCMPLPEGTWDRFCRQRQSKLGGSIEQYKHPCLVPHLDFCDKLLREFADAPASGHVA